MSVREGTAGRHWPARLDADRLAELFEGETALVRRLAEVDDPLGAGARIVHELPEHEQVEALNAHPPIGATALSAASAREQRADDDPSVLAELRELNHEYERRFGFRFVVFVDRRPRSAIVPILRERLERPRGEELRTGVDALVAIAHDRWERG